MSRNSRLYYLMSAELPRITHQRRLMYRTSLEEVVYFYQVINEDIFRNRLIMPEITVSPRCRGYWGICQAKSVEPIYYPGESSCTIKLMDKWYCRQWLITTLAHEMCHQFQWDIEGPRRLRRGQEPIMSHGPSFFMHRERLAKHGIPLRRAHRMRHWLKNQKIFEC